jgi:hypothetical protein
MNELMNHGVGLVFVVCIATFLFALVVLWFLLPFAIFGTKDKLSELIAESKKTNEQLSALRAEISEMKGNDDSIMNLRT